MIEGYVEGYKLPDLPEGWEATWIGCEVGDWTVTIIDGKLAPVLVENNARPLSIRIRRIKGACQYRPIESIAEAEPFFDEKVRFKGGSTIFKIHSIGECTVGIGLEIYTYAEAFDKFVLNDGTPFGMKVL